ncbi:alpha/beta fold hydrolase [Butyrivibrio sp. INlla14]|jgi:pimeloyl-ACP methyl ester carboxylesterase|uniref:alpha/beta fold hydrolase n=1 Tax=Butyrivibrio sp. INlla14 TaxID=1520808 RepID=UPI000876B603|nr:alpha/beta hydrolase [Butyrivibrio sp. INlla14]SCY59728.1 Pimeloyl-ACP methyl ester carboxylesterase [Butyrivibrio sp. INlla14]
MNTIINGLNINYIDEGQGPLLVMLHGWGSNIDLFAGVISFAKVKYHVVAMDMPGFGKSDEPAEPMNVDAYVDFVLSFVKELYPEEKEIIFLGHSMGGRIIIKLASGIHDGRIKTDFSIPKIILTDSAGVLPVRTKAQNSRTKRYKFYKNLITRTGIVKLFPGALDRLQKKFGSADYAAASPVMRKSLVMNVNEDCTPYMPSVTQPTLLIWGDRDTATPLSDGKKMEELMPEAGLAVIEGAGHYTFLDNPYLYNRILGSFLGI